MWKCMTQATAILLQVVRHSKGMQIMSGRIRYPSVLPLVGHCDSKCHIWEWYCRHAHVQSWPKMTRKHRKRMNYTVMLGYFLVTGNKKIETAFSNMAAHNSLPVAACRWWELMHRVYFPGSALNDKASVVPSRRQCTTSWECYHQWTPVVSYGHFLGCLAQS